MNAYRPKDLISYLGYPSCPYDLISEGVPVQQRHNSFIVHLVLMEVRVSQKRIFEKEDIKGI